MARFSDIVPTILMIVTQLTMAGVTVLYKLASSDGMKTSILVAYRFLFASAAVVPVALYIDRNKIPKLTWKVIVQTFTVAFFGGSLAQNMYAQSLVMTSATFVSAITNLIPGLTFILAIFFRFEKFEWKSWACRAKLAGTLICIGGAMLLILYKGVQIKMWPTGSALLPHGGRHVAATSHHSVIGPLVAIASSFSIAFSLMIQAKISENYPYYLSSSALICVMGLLQSMAYALYVEWNNWDEWHLGANIRLATVAYGGIVSSGLVIVISMYVMKLKGPLFTSLFNPLVLIIIAIVGSLFLDETLHLGSVLGAIMIIVGLYVGIWGKVKERPRGAGENPRQVEMMINEDEREVNNICSMVALGSVPSLPLRTSSLASASASVAHIDDELRDLEDGLSGEVIKSNTVNT